MRTRTRTFFAGLRRRYKPWSWAAAAWWATPPRRRRRRRRRRWRGRWRGRWSIATRVLTCAIARFYRCAQDARCRRGIFRPTLSQAQRASEVQAATRRWLSRACSTWAGVHVRYTQLSRSGNIDRHFSPRRAGEGRVAELPGPFAACNVIPANKKLKVERTYVLVPQFAKDRVCKLNVVM